MLFIYLPYIMKFSVFFKRWHFSFLKTLKYLSGIFLYATKSKRDEKGQALRGFSGLYVAYIQIVRMTFLFKCHLCIILAHIWVIPSHISINWHFWMHLSQITDLGSFQWQQKWGKIVFFKYSCSHVLIKGVKVGWQTFFLLIYVT